MRKEIFYNMSSWSQLFFLCLFFFIGLVVAASFTLFFNLNYPELVVTANFLRISVALQSCLLFLLPACLCAYFFNANPWRYLKINRLIDFRFLILAIVCIVLIQPFISYTGHLNRAIELPESMHLIQDTMKTWEDAAQLMTEKLLVTNSVLILIINIFVIGVVAGITEEFFFRGSIQQLINKIIPNYHVAIWLTAIIFSTVHFQFYGFIPRLLLGALLGYIFVWSGNLWISVIVHAVNNTLSVLLFHFFHDTKTYNEIENIGVGNTWWTVVASVVLVALILSLLAKESSINRIKEEEDYSDIS